MLTIILFEIKRNLRDKMSWVMLIGFPLALIFILGSTVGNILGGVLPNQTHIGVIDYDRGQFSQGFFQFLDSSEVKEIMTYTLIENTEDLDTDQYDGIVTLRAVATTNNVIELKALRNQVVIESLLGNFINTSKLVMTLMEQGMVPSIKINREVITRKSFNEGDKVPSGMDYYGILSLIQVLGFITVLGSNAIGRDYENSAFIRIKTSPINPNKILFGRIAGNWLFSMVTTGIVMAIAHFAMKVNYNGNLGILFAGIGIFSFLMLGIGVIIGSFTKNLGISISISMVMLMFFSTVSGSITPAAVNDLQYITPNYYLKNIFFTQSYGYPTSMMIEAFVVLFLMSVVIYGIALYLQRKVSHEII